MKLIKSAAGFCIVSEDMVSFYTLRNSEVGEMGLSAIIGNAKLALSIQKNWASWYYHPYIVTDAMKRNHEVIYKEYFFATNSLRVKDIIDLIVEEQKHSNRRL